MSQNPVEYRQLGSSGLRVSVPIIGAMSYGSPEWAPWVTGEEKSLEILKAAWDRGINTIDTANVYSNGESEKVVAFIEKYKIPRHQVIIASKCFGLVADEVGVRTVLKPELKSARQYVNQSGLSRAAIFNAVDASLERLKTSYIDLLQIHRYDPDVTAEETMKALHDLVQSGKVRYIGASSMRTWQFAHLNDVAAKNGWTKFVSMQNEYSLLYREEEREMLPYCRFNGIGVIRAPLAAGDLARPLSTADTTRIESTKGTPWEHKFSEADIANPWSYGEDNFIIAKKYIALLYQLIPYVKKLFQDLQATGKFIMRPLYYDFLLSDPFVANATRFNDPAVIHQFMSGQRLSIAPVGESGVTAKEVWMDEDFGSDGKFVNVSTPLDAISVFYLGSKDEILSGSV